MPAAFRCERLHAAYDPEMEVCGGVQCILVPFKYFTLCADPIAHNNTHWRNTLSESVKLHACHRRTVYVVLMIRPKEALWICCVCSPLRSHLPRLYWMTVLCWCEWVCACSYVYVVQGHLGKPPTVPPSHLQSANTSCCPILKKHTTHTLTRLNTLVWSRHD